MRNWPCLVRRMLAPADLPSLIAASVVSVTPVTGITHRCTVIALILIEGVFFFLVNLPVSFFPYLIGYDSWNDFEEFFVKFFQFPLFPPVCQDGEVRAVEKVLDEVKAMEEFLCEEDVVMDHPSFYKSPLFRLRNLKWRGQGGAQKRGHQERCEGE
ncbi:unnamed protein product [Cuscuta campestris]|uniref:Uncharacterized protein n=1 Tax=Cuscuta campestris TaxID=132261 RepID=A0A484KB35_9ASTE|nr:unnamed protein product [Cuscuta campestris]